MELMVVVNGKGGGDAPHSGNGKTNYICWKWSKTIKPRDHTGKVISAF